MVVHCENDTATLREESMKPIGAVFVGPFTHKPHYVEELGPALRTIHPREAIVLRSMQRAFWTNNPYFVDVFEYEEVFVCHLNRFKKLSEHPDAERFRAEMKAGEFWSMVGEEWVK
jgi:hypothetical protein